MTSFSKDFRVLLYSRSLAGHRASYLSFFSALLDGVRASASRISIDRRPAIFLMIEENFGLFALLALLRSATGRKTIGLLFRPLPAIEGTSLRLRLKRYMLHLLVRTPRTTVLSIVPVPLLPKSAAIVTGWIYDPQLWDLNARDRQLFTLLRAGETGDEIGEAARLIEMIRAKAAGRKVLIALGVQSRQKGFESLASQAAALAEAGYLVVVLGKVAAPMASAKEQLIAAGHWVEDRFASDDEFLAAYGAAHAVWCFYAAGYDQASGILGRAIQLGLPTVVRRASISHKLCLAETTPCAALADPGELCAALDRLEAGLSPAGEALANRFGETSTAILKRHLFEPEPS